MLDEALLGSNSVVGLADVVVYFADAILSAGRKHARAVDLQTLLADEGKQTLATVLLAAADSVAFGCGIEMLQPVHVDLDCPTLQRRQFEEMDRQAAQRRSADQVDQLLMLAEWFKQLKPSVLSCSGSFARAGFEPNRHDRSGGRVQGDGSGSGAKNCALPALGGCGKLAGSNRPGGITAEPELRRFPTNLGPLRKRARGRRRQGCFWGARRA